MLCVTHLVLTDFRHLLLFVFLGAFSRRDFRLCGDAKFNPSSLGLILSHIFEIKRERTPSLETAGRKVLSK